MLPAAAAIAAAPLAASASFVAVAEALHRVASKVRPRVGRPWAHRLAGLCESSHKRPLAHVCGRLHAICKRLEALEARDLLAAAAALATGRRRSRRC